MDATTATVVVPTGKKKKSSSSSSSVDSEARTGHTKASGLKVDNEEPPPERKRRRRREFRLTPAWRRRLEQATSEVQRAQLEEYANKGFLVMKNVFAREIVERLLQGESAPHDDDDESDECDSESSESLQPRRRPQRHASKQWKGARAVIHAHMAAGGGELAVRGEGRWDFQLPHDVREATATTRTLTDRGVFDLLRALCPRGTTRTQNVMLAMPGAKAQFVHTDSEWGATRKSPAPHYITVLIPLTHPDRETGGTRVWPASHRDYDKYETPGPDFVDMVSPNIEVGDALVFDGLLLHCGMKNESKDRERFFFYMAFSSRNDPNTEVTGAFV